MAEGRTRRSRIKEEKKRLDEHRPLKKTKSGRTGEGGLNETA